MTLFAVIRKRGPGWQTERALEGQQEWDAHARFMDDLAADGVVVLAGPLEGTSEVLIIMQADGPETIEKYLDADPWARLDLLRTDRILPWTLRLGTLPARRGPS